MQNLKIRKIQKQKQNIFFQKITSLAIMFIVWIFFLNSSKISFLTDISELWLWLITKTQLLNQIPNINDNSAIWPVKLVTNWGNITNYEQTKWTDFEKLANKDKTAFPDKISDIITQYKYITPYSIWDHISNPDERTKVLFYKRLITTTWAASYCYSNTDCKSWIQDSWTHAWVDIVSSINTPVYSIMNWIVLKKCTTNCDWFWTQMVIATDFNWILLATYYWHLNKMIDWVEEWDIIKKWQQIWYIWSTWISSAPHLHIQINKMWKTSEAKDIKSISETLYEIYREQKTVERIKTLTIDPINFIENNWIPWWSIWWWSVWDSFTLQDNNESNNEELLPPKEIDIDGSDLSKALETGNNDITTNNSSINTSTENPKIDNITIEQPVNDFKIIDIKTNKIDNKLFIWDKISFDIYTEWSHWLISVTTDNNILKSDSYTISPNWKNINTITITANSEWNSSIVFDDWDNKTTRYFSVYSDDNPIYWLRIEGSSTILSSTNEEYKIYQVDKLWNKVNSAMKWSFIVNLQDQDLLNEIKITEFTNNTNDSVVTFGVTAPWNKKYKLKVTYTSDKTKMFATKNLDTALFYDYTPDEQFYQSIKYLQENWIVKWTQWKLMPDKEISRSELMTILIRYKYKFTTDNIQEKESVFRSEMNNWTAKNWRFFKDISWIEWYAPYLFKAYQDGIMKWSQWKAFAEKSTTKAELLTFYWRYFWISNNEPTSSWNDIKKDDWFKEFADSAKKYNLYPFKNLKTFWADETVTRINAFESLYRFINHKPETIKTPTTPTIDIPVSNTTTTTTTTSINNTEIIDLPIDNSNSTSKDDELKNLMNNLLGN